MNNEALLEAKRKVSEILDKIDSIGVSTEVIENLNKLTCDKLEDLSQLEGNLGLPRDELLGKIWDVTRYSHCYITMNYVITNEVIKINETNTKIYEIFKELNTLLDAVKPLDDEKGQE